MFSPFAQPAGVMNDAAVIEQLALFDCVAYNRQDLVSRVAQDVGTITSLASYYDPDSYPPVWGVYQQGMSLYIHIGGTNQPVGGNVQNCMGAINTVPFSLPGAFTNSVWYNFASILAAQIFPYLPTPLSSYTINYVGHSHGSAISYLIACIYSTTYGAATWNWFGLASPRPFCGVRVAGPYLPQFGAVIVNQGDAVTLVPPRGALATVNNTNVRNLIVAGNQVRWYHPSDRYTYNSQGQRTRTSLTSLDPPLTPAALTNIGNTHPISTYNTTLSAYASANGISRPNCLSVINGVALLPDGDVFTSSFTPTSYVQFASFNQAAFGVVAPAPPVVEPANLSQLCWVTSYIVGPAEAGAIFTLLAKGAPMAGLKYVFQWTDGIQGFSEVFAQNLNAIPANILVQLGGYVGARLKVSGAQTTFKRVRVSVIGQRFSTAVFTADQLLAAGVISTGGIVGTAGGGSATDSDSPDTTLVVTLQSISGPPPAAARTRRLFLRGFPDYVNTKGGTYTPDGNYVNNMRNYINVGIAGGTPFGWYGQPGNGNNRVAITGLTNVGGQINIVLAAPGIFVGPPWTNVAIRIRGLTGGFRTLNGIMTVTPSSAVAATSIRNWNWPVTGAPQLQTAQAYLQTPGNFYPITGGGVTEIGERRAGRPFGQQPGRKPRVIRG